MDAADQQPQLGFRDYLHILWQRRWLIAGVTILAVAGSAAYSKSSAPVYQGTAQLLLTPEVSSAVLVSQDGDREGDTQPAECDSHARGNDQYRRRFHTIN